MQFPSALFLGSTQGFKEIQKSKVDLLLVFRWTRLGGKGAPLTADDYFRIIYKL